MSEESGWEAPAREWTATEAELVTWFRIRHGAEELPFGKFSPVPWITVHEPEGYYRSLLGDIAAGPGVGRAYYGALQGDLYDLRRYCDAEYEMQTNWHGKLKRIAEELRAAGELDTTAYTRARGKLANLMGRTEERAREEGGEALAGLWAAYDRQQEDRAAGTPGERKRDDLPASV